MFRYALLALTLLLFTYPAAVTAQSSNAALAQALYEQGKQLMDQGDYEAACDKFRQSQKLDPAGGTLLNLSMCLERSGKIASAWSSYKEALAAARRDGRNDRAEHIEERLQALDGKLSRVTLRVPNETEVSGLSVQLDGLELGRAAWDTAMPIDPGSHRVTATAPGKQPFEREIQIGAEADQQIIEIPPLKDQGPDISSGADATIDTGAGGSRTLGYLLGGVGVVALGVGSYFGVRAFSDWDRRNELCASGCNADAVEASEDAQTAANISTIGIGVGVVALVAGAYFILTDKPVAKAEQATRSEPRRVGLDANVWAGGAAVTVRSVF